MNFVRFFLGCGFDIDIAYRYRIPGVESGKSLFTSEYYLKETRRGESLFRGYCTKLKRYCIERVPPKVCDYDAVSKNVLLKAIASKKYTLILARYLYDTAILFALPGYRNRIIIDFDDVLSGQIFTYRYGSTAILTEKLKNIFHKRLLIRYERKCLCFGASLFCSEQDKDAVARENLNAFVIPNVYQGDSFRDYKFGNGFKNSHTLLFVGSLSYFANAEGLKWFVKDIFPFFKEIYLNAEVLVVGRAPSEEIRAICQNNGVQLHADVADVKEFYRKCRAVIVPLLAGAGTRIKILEAALAHRPILSTPLGAEGLGFKDGYELLLFKNRNDFLSKYRRLDNLERYDCLTRNASRLVKEKFSVEKFDESMSRVLEIMAISK
jgi:glycosyltransferase involved in cell wall biosynthesis